MKKIFTLFPFLFFLLIISCGEKSTPPASLQLGPSWVLAIPTEGAIHVSWEASLNTSYKVYYGTEISSYNGTGALQGESPVITDKSEITFTGLLNGTKYYFAVSYASSKGESVRSAQVSAIPFEETNRFLEFGSDGSDTAKGISVDKNGNTYIAGTTYGSFDVPNFGGADIFLAKYNVIGNQVWVRQIGTDKYDWAESVEVDASGEAVYITGFTYGDMDGANAGFEDIVIIKYDSQGNHHWTKQIGTAGHDIGYGIKTQNDYIYVTGKIGGSLNGQTYFGGPDIFLVKYDSSGNLIWTSQIGTNTTDIANGLDIDTSGNIVVVGYTGGKMGSTQYGDNDIVILKFNPAGSNIWIRQMGSSSTDTGSAVITDSDNNIYVAGSTYGTTFDGQASSDGYDAFLIKYDKDGNKNWTALTGTSENDYAKSLAVDSNNHPLLVGYTVGAFDGFTNLSGKYDFFIERFDSNGNINWIYQFEKSTDEAPYGASVDNYDNLHIAGGIEGKAFWYKAFASQIP